MTFTKTNFPGLIIIEPKVFSDDRGYFFESFSKQKMNGEGLDLNFVQDNISKSRKGTVRGLHYQVGENAQGKLCQVIAGEVLDIAVDIRFGSPTFGKYFSIKLSGENHSQLWIPPGFAHGFSVLSDEAVFYYKCTKYYSKPDERAIFFDDHDIGIDWLIDDPLVSEKDSKAARFKDIERDFIYNAF
jgi:dTDP-4-dehydrorhamnose 3,5-epimerase